MAEPITIYKLTILNMLDKVDFPLTNTQISNFFLEQDYTDYFRVQQVLSDLEDASLIHAESTHSNTQYTITAAGKETLGFFKDKITPAIERDTTAFLEKIINEDCAALTPSLLIITKHQIRIMQRAVSSVYMKPT